MVLIELVYCKITGRTRDLPKVHHFIPLVPWSCKKIKGKKKKEAPNVPDGGKERIKLVLDMSNEGPIFKMLESMLRGSSGGNEALNKLLKSGIPGLENLFTGKEFKFEKMSDEDKKRFLDAVTGAEGKVNSKAAAALIAAAASGGDPEIANKIIEKIMSGLGDEIDPAMMAALMATTALVAQGATNEEILQAMQKELANTGMTSDEILAKTMVLQKAMAGDNSPAFINKTIKNALYVANISTNDLAKLLSVQKILTSSGGTPEDIAKCMLIQSSLAAEGISKDLILRALTKIVEKDPSASSFEPLPKSSVSSIVGEEGITAENINGTVKLLRALEQRKVRGMKEIFLLVDELGKDLKSEDDVVNFLEKLVSSGVIHLPDLRRTMVIQRDLLKSGSNNLAKALLLQKTMSESGMTEYEISTAMTLVLNMEGLSTSSEIDSSLKDCSEEIIDVALSIIGELEDPKIPPEAVRLMRKAMKQRRGSVENVAETLMSALASSGESQESIAKAMVKALKAIGASPEEIARTISQALEKTGIPQDEIALIMAQAIAESGASAEEVAKALKQTFARAIKEDPSNAAELARYMAETLAASGASADEIAKTMHETLLETLTFGNERLLEIADSVARTMADAGASPQDIASALKIAMKAASAKDGSNVIQELAVTMAKTMISSNASVEETIKAIREALEMTGCTPDEIAECLMVAIAFSGADPTKTAETIQEILSNAGFCEEEIQQKILEAMIESGTSVSNMAHTMAKQKLLSYIGNSSDEVSKSLLKILRSGEKIDQQSLLKAFKSGGLNSTSVEKAIIFQKTLKALDLDPDTIVTFLGLQKEMLERGKAPQDIAEFLKNILGQQESEEAIENFLDAILSKTLDPEDISQGLSFEAVNNKSKRYDISSPEKALKELIAGCGKRGISGAKLGLFQKLINRLDISVADVAKVMGIQKSMYDSGASHQDIALAFDPKFLGEEPLFDKKDLIAFLYEPLNGDDISRASDLGDALKSSSMSSDLMSKIILIQSAVDAHLITPEKSAEEFCRLTKETVTDKNELALVLKDVLSKNRVSTETLKDLLLFEKAATLCGVSSDLIFSLNDLVKDLALSVECEEEVIENTLKKLFFSEEIFKTLGKKVLDFLSSPENSKLCKSELATASQLFQHLTNPSKDSSILLQNDEKDIESALQKAIADHPLLGGKGSDSLAGVLFLRSLFSEICLKDVNGIGNGMRILNKIWSEGDQITVFQTIQTMVGSTLGSIDTNMVNKIILGDSTPKTSVLSKFLSSLTAKPKLNLDNVDDEAIDAIFSSALSMTSLTDEDVSKAMLVQKVLSASGVPPEVLAQIVEFQKNMLAKGATFQEIAAALEKLTGGEDADLIGFLHGLAQGGNTDFNKESIAKLMDFQKGLSNGCDEESVISLLEKMDPNMISKALMVQKLLASANINPEDLGKVMFLQESLINAGSSFERISSCMEKSLFKSGMTLEHMLTLIEIELKTSGNGKRGRRQRVSPNEIKAMMSLDRVLSSGSSTVRVMRKLNPELMKLLEATVKYNASESNLDELLEVMEENFGPNVLQQKTLNAIVANAFMEQSGATKDEVEELMLMMMNKGGGISQHFIDSIQEIMKIEGDVEMKLEALKSAMEEEVNSLVNSLRNTFMCKDPSNEDLETIGNTIAMKLNADTASKNDVKLALIDILDEALQDVLEYELDSHLTYNYLMLASLAMTAHSLENQSGSITGEHIQEHTKEELLQMIERLLLEAELQGEIPKLHVYGKTFEGIKELLELLLSNKNTRSSLKRQVAFLYNFEEIENTTVLGLTLQEILKESKHILRPWDILKHRKIMGLKTSKVPKLTYSQVYCFYRVLPEHTDGPPIGLSYE